MKSVKGKLLRIIIPVTVMVMVVILAIMTSVSGRILTDYATKLLTAQSESGSNQLNGWVGNILTSLDTVKYSMESMNFSTTEEKENYVYGTTELNEYYPSGVYIGDDKGYFVSGDKWIPDKDYVVTERDWYKEGLNNERMTFGEPYVDKDTGDYTVTASAKIKGNNGTKAVMAGDVYLNSISDYIGKMKTMDGGITMLVDKGSSAILAHSDADKIAYVISKNDEDKLLASISELISSDSTGVSKVSGKDGKYYVDMEPVENTNWVLISSVKEKTILARLRKVQLGLTGVCIVAALVLALIIERTLNVILKPIKKLTEVILKITEGDFTADINVSSKDEIGVMAGALKKFIINMRSIIANINNNAKHIGEQSETSGDVSKNLNVLADNQSSAMNELSCTVEDLSKSITEIAEDATSLASVVSMANEDGSKAGEKMVSTVEVAGKGKNDMEKIQEAMDKIKESIESLKVTVEDVGESTTKIDGIINLIGDIASQTNLLSLNAAIEAARAGEHGRGFAVVAEEIRHLAETSSDAVQQINSLIKGISSKVMDTVNKTDASAKEINSNTELINTACDTFDDIYDNINMANQIMSDMINKVNNVDEVAANMAAITEEQSAGAEEILATSETLVEHSKNVTLSSEKLAKESGDLAVTSKVLKEYMEQFKI